MLRPPATKRDELATFRLIELRLLPEAGARWAGYQKQHSPSGGDAAI
jgi:hypothetical protein